MLESKTKNNATKLTKLSDREVVLTRIFNAPRALVFKVYTDPKSIPFWWGPRKHFTTVDKMDVKVGGLWRYVQNDRKGNEFAFNGEYREIIPDKRLVYTFEFESMPGHIILETIEFEDYKGTTKVTATALFQTTDDLNGMLNSGMEEGASESWDRLAELVEK